MRVVTQSDIGDFRTRIIASVYNFTNGVELFGSKEPPLLVRVLAFR